MGGRSVEELEAMRRVLAERQNEEHGLDFNGLDLTLPALTNAATATAPPAPDSKVPTCPRCANTTIRLPFVGWKAFQTSLAVYFMSLFTVSKFIETAARKANEPRPEDFIFNPFVQKTPRAYVPPDYSPLFIIAALGLCVIVFLFFSALKGHHTCEACGHRWK
jgi:hypothetical protein